MKHEQTKYFTIADIINNAVTNKSKPQTLTHSHSTPDISIAVLSELTYSNIWNVFSKWCLDQTQLGYVLNIFPFCTLFFTNNKLSDGIMLKPNEFFLKEYKLKFDEGCNESYQSLYDREFPPETQSQTQKINYIALSTELNSPKIVVQNGLMNLFNSIGHLLENNQFSHIDLGLLGQFRCSNKALVHAPSRVRSDELKNKKTTIKSMINRRSIDNGAFRKKSKRTTSQENIHENNKDSEFNRVLKQNASSASILKGMNVLPPVRQMRNDRIMYLPIQEPKWQIRDMMHVVFKCTSMKKPIANPVLFNCFSNTKAAPFTAEKTQIPITHRIGSFYTQSIQNLILDKTSKNIKRLNDDYFYKYRNISLQEPASELEEYLYIIHPEEVAKKKIALKHETYQRYIDFIHKSIPEDSIADIKKDWLKEIAKMSHRSYTITNLERYDLMLNNCIKEIILDYKLSMKTSILDYILKHPEQREKLGILMQFRKIKEYAEEKVERPSDNDYQWKLNWHRNKLLISNNLFLFGENITKIIKYFVKTLNKTSYVDLIEINDTWPTLKLSNFIENQKTRLELQKKKVNEDWRKYTEDILSHNAIYKDQLILYFNSVAGLMSSQLRKLVVDSIKRYHCFVKQFKKERYYSAKEVFKHQFEPDFPFQKSFIELEIEEGPDKLHYRFSDELNEIHTKLTNVVKEVIKYSQKVERADNLFIKKADQHGSLWAVPFNDSVISSMYDEIDSIINDNLKIISKVTELYEPFEFVMNEKEKLIEFIESKPKRDEYAKKIKFYEDKLQKMINEMQDFIYMNMIKINCVEINALIRKKLYDCIIDLLNNIKKKNIIDKAKELGDTCEKLMGRLDSQISSEEMLFQLENDVENYKESTVPELFVEYNDFLEWVFFYFKYDTYNVLEPTKDSINSIEHNILSSHEYFLRIEVSMKTFTEALEAQKRKMTAALDKERLRVLQNITDLKVNVDDCKDHISSKILSDDSTLFLSELKELQKIAEECGSDLETLVKKEGFLGNAFLTEDERIDQCFNDLNPMIRYLEFINEYKDILRTEKEEIYTLNFTSLNSIVDQYDIFDISIQKIPSYKGKIQKAKGEFERFRHTVDYCRLIAPLVEIFKYENIEDTDIFSDNMFYCDQVGVFLPLLLKSTPEDTQNTFRAMKLKDVLMSSQLMEQFNRGRAEIEKLVAEWQNVMNMYELQAKMIEEIDIEFQIDSYQNKNYFIINHDCLSMMKITIQKYVDSINDKLLFFETARDNLVIFSTILDYQKKLTTLLDMITEIDTNQTLLEEFMERTTIIKKKPDGFQLLKQAEKEFATLIEMIKEQRPKMFGLLQTDIQSFCKEILSTLTQLLGDIKIINEELKKYHQ